MKAKEIQDLIDFISKSGLDEVNIETEEFKIKVRKNSETKSKNFYTTAPAAPAPQQSAPSPAPSSPGPSQESSSPAPEADSDAKYLPVKSPMIGTFYRSASPEDGPFIQVGDKITAGQTVCIVEAMKLFNEIESEISGTVVKVLVDNASPVEYDQPLFLVDPS